MKTLAKHLAPTWQDDLRSAIIGDGLAMTCDMPAVVALRDGNAHCLRGER